MTVDPRLARYDHFIIHVTATTSMMDLTPAMLHSMHRQRGFRTTGYHAFIRRGGICHTFDSGAPLRPYGEIGAHVGDCGAGWNSRSFGISLAGGVDGRGRPENNLRREQFATLRRFLMNWLDAHPNPGVVRILGHRDLIRMTSAPPKACPCFDVSDWLQTWVSKPSQRPVSDEIEDEDLSRQKPAKSPMLLANHSTYTVVAHDTLTKIAKLHGVSIQQLTDLNPSVDPLRLQIGSELTIQT